MESVLWRAREGFALLHRLGADDDDAADAVDDDGG